MATANPDHIRITLTQDGKYGWDAFYHNEGLDQGGYTATLDEAMECVRGAVANGRGAAAQETPDAA